MVIYSHRGSFEPIVSEEVFEQAQRIITSKGNKHSQHITDNPDFPLRRFVTNQNGRKLTGSWSTGRKKKYPFYRFGGKGSNYNRDMFENIFMDYMDYYGIKEKHVGKLKTLVKKHLVDSAKQEIDSQNQLRKYISDLDVKQSALIQKNINGVIPDTVLKQELEHLQKAQNGAQEALLAIPDRTVNFEEIINFTEEYLKKPSAIWKEAKMGVKIKLQRFQFPQGLIFEDNFFGTKEIASIFNVKSSFLGEDSTVVDMSSKTYNSLKTYLSEFWVYYNSSKMIQNILINQ